MLIVFVFADGEEYSDQSYEVTSEESDSDSEAGANNEGESVACSVRDEQRSRILNMADIFKTMFEDIVSPLGESSSTLQMGESSATLQVGETSSTRQCDSLSHTIGIWKALLIIFE